MLEMKFERGINSIAWGTLSDNFTAFAFLALAVVLIDQVLLVIGKAGGSAGGSLFVTIMINLAAHTTALHDASKIESGTAAQRRPLPIFRFFWWNFLLMLPAMLAAVFFFPICGGGNGGVALSVLALIIVFSVALGLFGTILPVIALGGSVDLRAALARGKKVFAPTIGWLVIGLGAFWVLLLVGQTILGVLGAQSAAYDPDTGQLSPLGVADSILVMLGIIFAALLAAAALCKAYYRGQAVIQ